MPYTYEGYTLHTRTVLLRGDREQRIYFFAKSKPKSGHPCDLPPGYQVAKNPRTGLPYLKKV